MHRLAVAFCVCVCVQLRPDLSKDTCLEYSKHLSNMKATAKTVRGVQEPDDLTACISSLCMQSDDDAAADGNEAIKSMLDAMSVICADFGKSLVRQCIQDFKGTMVAQLPEFKSMAEAKELDVTAVFLPFTLTMDDAKDILTDKEVSALMVAMSNFKRDDKIYAEARSVLENWANAEHSVRALQVLRGFSDAQVAFAKLVGPFQNNVLQACAAASASLAAHTNANTKTSSGQRELVNESLITKLAMLKGDIQGLEFAGDADNDLLIPPAALAKYREYADGALSVLMEIMAVRWGVALTAACTSLSNYMPQGDWRDYGIKNFKEAEVIEHIIGNTNHLKLAQLAEWSRPQRNNSV